jgi:DNA repair exonuclease SbcCD ATPase subunit
VEAAAKVVERAAARAAEALGGGVAEAKVLARLDEALREREAERQRLAKAVEALEADLEAVEQRQRNVSAVLLPAVAKREELAAHEQRREEAKARHAAREARALAMERRAEQFDAIRKALLAAKQDLASEVLERAAPRAQALYARLVRHALFPRLDVQVNAKAAKVDYVLQVSTAGGVARDARLVLSDGQLTATAMALFFGLAESTAHALDLLYVDDPTQNLDGPCKEAMAKVVAEMARRRQVIVATQDEDFVAYLDAAGFQREAVVHRIADWDGDPRVETSPPGAEG